MHTQQITSALRPPNRAPIPLDTFAGLTTAGECRTEEGPVIKTHLQWHATERRFVGVTTLEDHISKQYMMSMPGLIKDLKFNSYHDKGAYVSAACKPYEDGLKHSSSPPRVEFSNSHQYEAAPAQVFDINCITMANTLNTIQDTAFKKATDIIQKLLLEQSTSQRDSIKSVPSYHSMMNEKSEKEKVDYDGDQRNWPKNNGESCRHPIALLSSPTKAKPLDDQDSVICNLSDGQAPYTSHSDVENKHGNHSNKLSYACAEQMRILTASYSCHKCTSTQAVPKDMLSIYHIIPGEKSKRLEYVGYFSKDGFTKVKDNALITFGGEDGAHFQHPGSQYNLHHLVKPLNSQIMKGILRLIMSTRRIRPFQHLLPSSGYNLHRIGKQTNIIETIRGSCALHVDGVQNTTTSVKVKNNQEEKLPSWTNIMFSSNIESMQKVEHIRRGSIIGPGPSVGTIDLIKSTPVVEYLSKEKNVTLQFNILGEPITVGHLVDENGKLVRPGTKFDQVTINNTYSIKQNNNKKSIFSIDRKYASVVSLVRLTKNGSDLAECLDSVLASYHNDNEYSPLFSFKVGGVGGAITTAGSTVTKTRVGAKNAPTTILPHRQSMDDDVIKALLRAASVERCVHVFVGGVYLGLFHIKDVRVNKTPHKQAKMMAKRLDLLLLKLKQYDEFKDIASINEKTINEEMSWITTMGPTFTMVPVDPTFHHLWKHLKHDEEPKWNFKELKDTEVESFLQQPSIAMRKSDVGKVSGILGNGTLTDVSSLVKKNPLLLFTDKGREFLASFNKEDYNEEEKTDKAKAQEEVQKHEKHKLLEDLLYDLDETETSDTPDLNKYANLMRDNSTEMLDKILKFIDSLEKEEDEEKEEIDPLEKVRSSNS